MRGRARVFGHDITLDEIHPGAYFSLDPDEMVKGLMEGVCPGFHKTVRGDDMIVAGRYFGMGSGRESGAWAMKLAGVQYVIAESFSRYMFRNCVNNGIWPLEVKDILDHVKEGDMLEVDLQEGRVTTEDGTELKFQRFPPWMVNLIKARL
ncbi:MAG: 3-isopropylmalate dehydratase [Thermoplasmata archaeon]